LSRSSGSAITPPMFARLIPDRFILLLLGVIGLASLLPAKGAALVAVGHVANAAIFLLFFFHGLRLAPAAVWEGVRHWRLQAAVMACTFLALPLGGLALAHLVPSLLPPELWLGVLFLCALPSTVQAAIASSSLAGGNVAASVIAAALSNLAGVILTPVIFTAIAQVSGVEISLGSITRIATLLLLPFALGQVARPLIGGWAEQNRVWIGRMDRMTIMLTLYVTFSAAVNEGLWGRLSGGAFAALLALVLIMLALAFAGSWGLGGALGLTRADRITLLFSGTHKSLATGAPMARILFPAAQAGLIIIPLMLYHQLQLIISAWIAARLSRPT
jgi:solute carrier family 10 (sodium/bile acid cotransporter), member 7